MWDREGGRGKVDLQPSPMELKIGSESQFFPNESRIHPVPCAVTVETSVPIVNKTNNHFSIRDGGFAKWYEMCTTVISALQKFLSLLTVLETMSRTLTSARLAILTLAATFPSQNPWRATKCRIPVLSLIPSFDGRRPTPPSIG